MVHSKFLYKAQVYAIIFKTIKSADSYSLIVRKLDKILVYGKT